jgi:dUTP pyrophosphatase
LAVNHISHQNNTIHGADGIIKVTFPNFNFNFRATENFEFNITPGKHTNKPVIWQPHESQRINNIEHEDKFQIKRLSQDAVLPQQATVDATGYDISSSTSTTISPHTTTTVPLSFSMSYSLKLKCDLRPRSSLSLKGINVSLGTIDPDFRGEIKAIITNTTNKPFNIHLGYRLGHLVFSPVSHPEPQEVSKLDHSKRGHNDFGSTRTNSLGTANLVSTGTRSFEPVLLPISELPLKSRSPPSETIDPNTISFSELDSITDEFTKYIHPSVPQIHV